MAQNCNPIRRTALPAPAELRLLFLALLASLGLAATACAQAAPTAASGSGMPLTPLLRDAPKAVLAHVMVSFGTPQISGGWRGWDNSNSKVHHDPNKIGPHGRRDIASIYTPAIGPYDMADPDTAEYHCQLARMAGIDGFVFDLGFYDEPGSGAPSADRKVMDTYVPMMAAYGLRAAMVYEDKAHWVWDRATTTREAAVQAATADLNSWLGLLKPVQYRIGTRPLVLFFSYGSEVPGKGTGRLSPEELRQWTSDFPAASRPVTLTQWLKPEYYGVLDGHYDWVLMDKAPPDRAPFVEYADRTTVQNLRDHARKDARWLLENGHADFYIPCAFPGFDDRGVWGWGDGPRQVPRDNGLIYQDTWQEALRDQLPVVQIATWNDWFEGTAIEPSQEFGDRYLDLTRKYAARLKDKPIPAGDFRLPQWIYQIRKADHTPAVQAVIRRACILMRRGDYTRAEAIVRPLVQRKNDARGPMMWPVFHVHSIHSMAAASAAAAAGSGSKDPGAAGLEGGTNDAGRESAGMDPRVERARDGGRPKGRRGITARAPACEKVWSPIRRKPAAHPSSRLRNSSEVGERVLTAERLAEVME